MGGVSFQMGAARRRLAEVTAGLRAAASGAVVERAAAQVQAQIDAVSRAKLAKHTASGAALGALKASRSGGLVQLTAKGYLRYHRWWPFRRGMPPFVTRNATKIFKAAWDAVVMDRTSAPSLERGE